MTDSSQVLTPPWYLSRTIWANGLTAAFVVVNTLGAKYGFQIDGQHWSETLASDFVDIATLLSIVYAAYRHFLSKKATTVTVATPITVPANSETTVAVTSELPK